MSGILYRGLLRRLSKWHLSSLPLPQSAGAMQGTTKGKKSVLSPDPHDDEAIREETLELAKNEMRWMLDEAQRGTTATASREQFAETAPPSVVGRKLISMVRRRVHHHEPLAYILGNQPFGPLSIKVKPPLLIPRPETEEWTLQVVQRMQEALAQRTSQSVPPAPKLFRVLDLCCGTGCIGLTLAKALTTSQLPLSVHFVDKSGAALQCVMDNLEANHVKSKSLQVATCQMDIMGLPKERVLAQFAEMTDSQGFDMVLCNPPYIPTDDYDNLDASVKNWEDRDALCGDVGETADGLAFYRRIASLLEASQSHVRLLSCIDHERYKAGMPQIVLEVGKGQHEQVEKLLRGITKVDSTPLVTQSEIWQDAFGVERAVAGYVTFESSEQTRDTS